MKNKTVTSTPVRDASGRFASKVTVKGNSTKSNSSTSKSNSNSTKSNSSKVSTAVKTPVTPDKSFIQNISLNNDGLFQVVMARNPRTTYFYKATSKGAKVVLNAIKSGKNLGHAFNTHLKSREVGRYIAVK